MNILPHFFLVIIVPITTIFIFAEPLESIADLRLLIFQRSSLKSKNILLGNQKWSNSEIRKYCI